MAEQTQQPDPMRTQGRTSQVDEVGRSGVYPASGPLPEGPADVREQGEFAHPDERRQHLLTEGRGHDVDRTLHLIGRAVFGGYFLYNGINHFVNREMLSGYAKHKGLPLADIAVPASGAMLVAGGLSLLLGKRPKLGTGLIMGFLATSMPTMHAFWADRDEQERGADVINFARNIGLIGAALLAASLPEPWPFSVDRPARH
jgi:putative oxidoreductase